LTNASSNTIIVQIKTDGYNKKYLSLTVNAALNDLNQENNTKVAYKVPGTESRLYKSAI